MKKTAVMLVCLICCLVLFSQPAEADDAYLKSMGNDLVAALNSHDPAQRETFLKKYYINADSASAIERWQGHLSRYADMLGEVKVHGIDLSDPRQVRILIYTDNSRVLNQWSNLILNLDESIKDKFRTAQIDPGQNPNIVLPDRALTDDEIAQYLKDYIDDLVARDVFSGTVKITHEGKTVFEGAYGKADLRWGIDNKIDTKFNLGSMNKMFTGVAICQLVEQGKVSFDAPIGRYLKDLSNREYAEVTVHQLLTHTSGMDSYWDAMAEMDWTALRSVKDFADLNINDTLLFEPGDHFHYSNSGPLYLGLIIEAISGMDYHDYIRKYVTGPAGMPNTDCYENDAIVPNLAQGYWWDDEINNFRTNIFEHSARGSAAGGGFSTVPDLQNFAKALYDGRLLSQEMLKTYTTGKVETGPDEMYAYLIGDDIWEGHRVVGHSGGAPGINSDLKILPDLKYVVTAMSNYDNAASAISHYATDLIIHKRTQ